MIEKLCVLVAVGAIGGLATGCGSSSSTTTTGATASSTGSTPTTASTPTLTTGASSGQIKAAEAANPALAKAVAEAVAQCKATVKAQPTLSNSDKSKLYTICDEAATGNEAAVRKAAADVCQQVIKDTVPAASRAQALASCPKP